MTLSEEVTEQTYSATMGPHGRVVIPAPLRKQLELSEGTTLTFHRQGDVLVATSPLAAFRKWQKLLREATPPGVDLVEELIAERREEARKETEWMAE